MILQQPLLSIWCLCLILSTNHQQLITPTFSNNPSKDVYLYLTKKVKYIIESNGKKMLAVLLWRELQGGVLIDCIRHTAFVCPVTHQTCWATTPVFTSSQGPLPTSGGRVIQGQWLRKGHDIPFRPVKYESWFLQDSCNRGISYPHLHHHHWTTSPPMRDCRFPLLGHENLDRLLSICGVWLEIMLGLLWLTISVKHSIYTIKDSLYNSGISYSNLYPPHWTTLHHPGNGVHSNLALGPKNWVIYEHI